MDAKQTRNPRREERPEWGGEQFGTTCRPIAVALDLAPGLHGVGGSMARLIGSSGRRFIDPANGQRGEANR